MRGGGDDVEEGGVGFDGEGRSKTLALVNVQWPFIIYIHIVGASTFLFTVS